MATKLVECPVVDNAPARVNVLYSCVGGSGVIRNNVAIFLPCNTKKPSHKQCTLVHWGFGVDLKPNGQKEILLFLHNVYNVEII